MRAEASGGCGCGLLWTELDGGKVGNDTRVLVLRAVIPMVTPARCRWDEWGRVKRACDRLQGRPSAYHIYTTRAFLGIIQYRIQVQDWARK